MCRSPARPQPAVSSVNLAGTTARVNLYSETPAPQVYVLSNLVCRVTSRLCYQPTRFWGLCFLADGCPRLRLGSAKQLVALPHRHRTRTHLSQVPTGLPLPLMHATLQNTRSTAGMHQPCKYGVKPGAIPACTCA